MRHQGPPAVITLPGQTVVYGHTAWWHNALYVSCQIKVYSAKDDRKPGSQQSLLYTVDFLGPLVKGFSKVWKLHLLVPAHLHVSLLPWRNLRRALQPVSSLETAHSQAPARAHGDTGVMGAAPRGLWF